MAMTADLDLERATRMYDTVAKARVFVLDGLMRALAKGDRGRARIMLEARGVRPEHLAILDKAATAAHTTTSGLAEMRLFWSAFLDYGNPLSALGRAGFRAAPPHVRIPLEGTPPEVVVVDEGRPVPVRSLLTDNVRLEARKVAIAVAITKELARSQEPAALTAILRILERAVLLGSDREAFDPARVGSLTAAAVQVAATGSHNDDVANLLGAISGGVPTRPVIITGLHAARVLAFSSGGVFPDVKLTGTGAIAGVPQLPTSSAALAPYVIAADSDGVALADLGVELDEADAATLQMDDAPTNASADGSSPPAPVHTQVVSLWQANSIGLKALRFVNWAARSDAVAYLDLTSGSPA